MVLNSGDGQLELGRLVGQGQLADLRPLLNAPAWDNSDATVQDAVLPGMLALAKYRRG